MGAPEGNNNGYTPSKSICWKCKNAVPDGKDGCSWSRFFIPVEGWTEKQSYKLKDSYTVLECPKFVPEEHSDERVKKLIKKANNYESKARREYLYGNTEKAEEFMRKGRVHREVAWEMERGGVA